MQGKTLKELQEALEKNDQKVLVDIIKHIDFIVSQIVEKESFYKVEEEDVKDIVQNVSEALAKLLSSDKHIDNIYSYLRVIAHNKTMDFFRKKKYLDSIDSDSWRLWQQVEIVLEKEEYKALIELALELVGESCKTNLIQRVLDGQPHKEIAEKKGMTVGAIRKTHQRCKEKFIKIILEDPRFLPLKQEPCIQKFLKEEIR